MTMFALALLQEKTAVLVEDNEFLLEVMMGHLECYGLFVRPLELLMNNLRQPVIAD